MDLAERDGGCVSGSSKGGSVLLRKPGRAFLAAYAGVVFPTLWGVRYLLAKADGTATQWPPGMSDYVLCTAGAVGAVVWIVLYPRLMRRVGTADTAMSRMAFVIAGLGLLAIPGVVVPSIGDFRLAVFCALLVSLLGVVEAVASSRIATWYVSDSRVPLERRVEALRLEYEKWWKVVSYAMTVIGAVGVAGLLQWPVPEGATAQRHIMAVKCVIALLTLPGVGAFLLACREKIEFAHGQLRSLLVSTEPEH